MSPPRTANWPTSSTRDARSNPLSSSISWKPWKPGSSPTETVIRSSASSRGTGVLSWRALSVVTSSRVRPLKRASAASTRSPPISRWGSVDS